MLPDVAFSKEGFFFISQNILHLFSFVNRILLINVIVSLQDYKNPSNKLHITDLVIVYQKYKICDSIQIILLRISKEKQCMVFYTGHLLETFLEESDDSTIEEEEGLNPALWAHMALNMLAPGCIS